MPRRLLLSAALGLMALGASAQQNDKINQAIEATVQSNRAAVASQGRINGVDDSTRSMLERYRAATWQAQQLNVYAKQLEQLQGAQAAEKASLAQQLVEIERTERELTPLMLRMLDSMDKFVSLDLPFLKQERRERVEGRRRDRAAKGAAGAKADIVGHDDQDIGSPLGGADRLRPAGRRGFRRRAAVDFRGRSIGGLGDSRR